MKMIKHVIAAGLTLVGMAAQAKQTSVIYYGVGRFDGSPVQENCSLSVSTNDNFTFMTMMKGRISAGWGISYTILKDGKVEVSETTCDPHVMNVQVLKNRDQLSIVCENEFVSKRIEVKTDAKGEVQEASYYSSGFMGSGECGNFYDSYDSSDRG